MKMLLKKFILKLTFADFKKDLHLILYFLLSIYLLLNYHFHLKDFLALSLYYQFKALIMCKREKIFISKY